MKNINLHFVFSARSNGFIIHVLILHHHQKANGFVLNALLQCGEGDPGRIEYKEYCICVLRDTVIDCLAIELFDYRMNHENAVNSQY